MLLLFLHDLILYFLFSLLFSPSLGADLSVVLC